ncbi:APC family permease [Dictyobacter formicarum]|uniref:Amino acid permease n=1 Tax=Dictyobacter formicarum TaxID=2778368 RepID=A0ABQ3VL82_9CHLR|nr:amino acid permease [Dictyobacter formicarum]GHO85846.1 amino acid permease [Dictyobacter formicarum]
MKQNVVRTIRLPQAIALYVAAVIGAGVLLLPGLAATTAGPASILAWIFDCCLGIPLALTFAALASRYPDAGGVATFTTRAFGPAVGAVTGWFYFIASIVGQIIVPLTGAYYIADALYLGRDATFLIAAAILIAAIVPNLYGLRVSGRLALLLSASVALLLLIATLVSIPRMHAVHWTPFAPHGLPAIGQAGVLIFFAFFGWEAIAQLSAEFIHPERDVPRSTLWSVGLVTILYLGVAIATIGTGTYGTAALDRVSVARLLSDALGIGAGAVAAVMALVISLGTVNAYVAASSRLGYALARDRALPGWLEQLDRQGIPRRSLLFIGVVALLGLILTYLVGWSASSLLIIPNSLGIATYVIGTAAGAWLLAGLSRWLAAGSCLLCLAIFFFAGTSIAIPLIIATVALVYRQWRCQKKSLHSLDAGPR